MERKKTMFALFGLNLLFYLLDLFILYYKYVLQPERFVGVFDFKLFFSFLFSLILMIPTIAAYFILFNYLKEQERIEQVQQMIMMTVINFALTVGAALYAIQL